MANSLALFGDAIASCVDVITVRTSTTNDGTSTIISPMFSIVQYFMNWYAEAVTTPDEPVALEDCSSPTNHIANGDSQIRLDRQTRLIHEVYAPTLSVIALIGVTIFILIVASFEIASGGDDATNADIMFTFASVNVAIDAICIVLFYFRKDDILYHRFPSFTGDTEHVPHSPCPSSPVLRNVNINMFSAFTHIGSDTLRTAAIFLAAIVSTTTGNSRKHNLIDNLCVIEIFVYFIIVGIKSSLCDAWAAVLVSVTIIVAVIPLATEVFAAYTGER